uniref:Ig-like domain-containing protein n=1 Tax=Cyprinus carpio TaxID=7962 RepID=A0A8C1YA24_CYPCA
MICRKGHFHSIFLFYNFVWLILMLISSGYVDTVSVSVMEGDSVTLYTDVETIQQVEIRWYFNDIHIAAISGDLNKTCTDVQCCYGTERFRDRLKLDHQTGSLTITNITTTDSGLLKLQINSSSDSLLQLFSVSVYDVPEREKIKSVKEGDSVTLDPGVVKKTNYLMKWLFNDVRIAEINGDLSFICADVQCLYADVRFRDRLKLNHITASLTITNTRTTDSGLYYLLITSIRFNIIKSFIVNVTGVYGVHTDSVSVIEGDSVILHTDVETNQQKEIRWYFYEIRIAQITGDLSFICTDCKYSDERFRDRLKLDNKTGSLTITNITITDYGVYHLEIIRDSGIRHDSFSVAVHGVSAAERDEMKMKSVKEGESVTLEFDVINNLNYPMTWYFNDICMTKITRNQSKICEDSDEGFRDRLKVDHQTGSLTITDVRTTDSGDYKIQINSSSRISIIKSFIVNVTGVSSADKDGGSVSVKEGDSVTLQTSFKTDKPEKMIWYFDGFQIAEMTGDLSYICTDVQCNKGNERFRDRLKLDHQSGSLTITNITNTDSGLYKLKIFSKSGRISRKIYSVAVYGFSGVGSDGVSAFVMEEDSVTLYTDVETNQQKGVRWFNNDSLIAVIAGDLSNFCTDVQCDKGTERFRDRLQLDHQTGSLTITNIRTTDYGRYELEIISSSLNADHQRKVSKKTFSVAPPGVSAAQRDEVKRKSVKEGESVTLDTRVIKNPNLIKWYFNHTLIAEIIGDQSKICTDDQCEERFRDRMKLDNQTGSLTITNSRTTDSGLYKLHINSTYIHITRSFSVTVTADLTGVYTAVSVVLLLVVASAAIFYTCKWHSRRNYITRNNTDQVNVEDLSIDQNDSLLMTPTSQTSPTETNAANETPT